MKKKLLSVTILILALVLLCSCGLDDILPGGGGEKLDVDPIELEGEIIRIPDDAASYERLLIEADNYMTEGHRYELFGFEIAAQYYYGLALAGVTSLRFTTENIIYLRDKDIDMLELRDSAIYIGWDRIVETSFSSPWPAYFEGLLCEFEGKKDEAEECYTIAKDNPLWYDTDFYYLKTWSLDDLYKLKNMCLEKEMEIAERFTPQTKLLSREHTGAEYIADYHLYVMNKFKESDENFVQAAINFLSVTPFNEDGYCFLYLAYLNRGDVETALYYLDEGYFINPDGELINYYMGASYYSMKDYDRAKECLAIAAASEEKALSDKANALLSKIS